MQTPPFGDTVMDLAFFSSTYLGVSVLLTSQGALRLGRVPRRAWLVTAACLLGLPCAPASVEKPRAGVPLHTGV